MIADVLRGMRCQPERIGLVLMEAQLTSRDLRGSGLIEWIKFQRRSPAGDADEPRQLSTIEPVAPINELGALNVIPEFLLQNQCFFPRGRQEKQKTHSDQNPSGSPI